jgi:hypothetical protein
MKLTIRLALLLALCAAPLRAAVIECRAGGNVQSAVNSAQNGDTVLLDEAPYTSGVISLSGKSNVTIVSRKLWDGSKIITDKPVVIETQWDVIVGLSSVSLIPADVARPTTRLNLPRGARGLFTDNAHGVKLVGLHVVNAGWRPTNTNDVYAQDCVFESTDGWAAIEADGYTPDNGPGGLSKRAHGFTMLRVAAIDGGGSGINLSWTTNVRLKRCYSFRNNQGRAFNFLPGFCTQTGGRWYANVQNAGGGGKISGCSDVLIQECVYRGSNGVQLWYDWLCNGCTAEDCYLGDAGWKQFNYDSVATQAEIVGPDITYRRCLFNAAVIGSNVCESNGVKFEDCEWLGVPANHRNIWDDQSQQIRNGGCYNISYVRARFYNGAWFGWWLGFPHGENMTEAYRAAHNITGDKTAIFNAALPAAFKWTKNGSGGTTQPVDPDPDPDPTTTSWTYMPPAVALRTVDGSVWRLRQDGKLTLNRVLRDETAGVEKGVWTGAQFVQKASSGWWAWNGAGWQATAEPMPTTQPIDPTTQPSFKGVTVTTEVDVSSDGKATVRGAPTTRPKAPVP